MRFKLLERIALLIADKHQKIQSKLLFIDLTYSYHSAAQRAA